MSEPIENINLHSKESRTIITKMVMRLFGLWRISISDQAAILNRSPSTIHRYRNGGRFADDDEMHDRMGCLLRIHKNLRILYPHNRDLVYQWVSRNNQRFEDQTPVELMKLGLDGIIRVRTYLDQYLSL